ncbi:hypothetical protein CYMTET_48889 [Cymbomonas tetramitiformis]|uniref:Photosynthesis system II assembly factor Ycf48/Hcf136-like domain-containing protein n=1 Tax=Cymbomonas tetramitiformis TaxID=36881 RepID=A0AAE0EV32_9CHLO|nr:hypothetical protein CYMTET_48889 [Cymbomonas tetramitiformis]
MRIQLIILGITYRCALGAYDNWGFVELNSTTKNCLKDVYPVDSLQVWAVGEDDSILRSVDGGDTWTLTHSGLLPPCENCARYKWQSVHFYDEENGWVVGTYGMVMKWTETEEEDGVFVWQPQMTHDSLVFDGMHHTVDLHDVQAVSSRMAYIVGDYGFIMRTVDGGANWVKLESRVVDNLYSLSFVNRTHGWVVGSIGSRLLFTSNAGQTWSVQFISAVSWPQLSAVYFASGLLGWAVGREGGIVRTKDSGVSWEEQSACTDLGLRSIRVETSTGYGFAVGEEGVICWSYDGGASWEHRLVQDSTALHAVNGDPAGVSYEQVNGVGYIVGELDIVLRTDDWGNTWAVQQTLLGVESTDCQPVCERFTWYGVSFYDSWTGWVVGGFNKIARTADGGMSWSGQTAPDPQQLSSLLAVSASEINLRAVAAASTLEAWAVGDYAVVYHTLDGGESWEHQGGGSISRLYDMRAMLNLQGMSQWVLGAETPLLAQRLAQLDLTPPVYDRSLSKIWHSSDRGDTWRDSGFNNNAVYNAMFVSQNATQGWVAGDQGALAYTADGGTTWVDLEPATTANLYGVSLDESSGRGFAVGERGVIVQTFDGGLTWTHQVVDSGPRGSQLVDGVTLHAVQEWPTAPFASRTSDACWAAGFHASGENGEVKRFICSPLAPPPPQSPPMPISRPHARCPRDTLIRPTPAPASPPPRPPPPHPPPTPKSEPPLTPPTPVCQPAYEDTLHINVTATCSLAALDFDTLQASLGGVDDLEHRIVTAVANFTAMPYCSVRVLGIAAGSTHASFVATFPTSQADQADQLAAALRETPASVFQDVYFEVNGPLTLLDVAIATNSISPPPLPSLPPTPPSLPDTPPTSPPLPPRPPPVWLLPPFPLTPSPNSTFDDEGDQALSEEVWFLVMASLLMAGMAGCSSWLVYYCLRRYPHAWMKMDEHAMNSIVPYSGSSRDGADSPEEFKHWWAAYAQHYTEKMAIKEEDLMPESPTPTPSTQNSSPPATGLIARTFPSEASLMGPGTSPLPKKGWLNHGKKPMLPGDISEPSMLLPAKSEDMK